MFGMKAIVHACKKNMYKSHISAVVVVVMVVIVTVTEIVVAAAATAVSSDVHN